MTETLINLNLGQRYNIHYVDPLADDRNDEADDLSYTGQGEYVDITLLDKDTGQLLYGFFVGDFFGVTTICFFPITAIEL